MKFHQTELMYEFHVKGLTETDAYVRMIGQKGKLEPALDYLAS